MPLSYQGTILVRLTGLEPVRPYRHQILSLVRLPITPQSLIWSGVRGSNPHCDVRSVLYYPLYERQKTLLYHIFVVLSTRIELVSHPYQGRVLPLYYESNVLAERLRLELRNPLSRVDGLAIRSNTIMGPFLNSLLM